MLSLYSASLLSGVTPLFSCILALASLRHLSASTSARLTNMLLGISTGLMFAIATLELIPEAVSLSQPVTAEHACFDQHAKTSSSSLAAEHSHHGDSEHFAVQKNLMGCGVGFLFLLVVQQLLVLSGHGHSHSHHVKKDQLEPPENPKSFRVVTFIALGVHCLIDGLVIAGAYSASDGVGASVALAIILHKIPDGLLLVTLLWISRPLLPTLSSSSSSSSSSSLSSSGQLPTQSDSSDASPANLLTDRLSLSVIVLLSALTPLGAYLTTTFLSTSDYNGFILAFGAGTFLFLSTIEIIPELLKEKHHRLFSLLMLAVGYAAFFVFEFFAHASQDALDSSS